MAVRNAVATLGLVFFGLAFRFLFVFAYRSTDFEVHRHWLAITHSLPISRWYHEETSQWTLDYPPLFAYFEWLLSQFAAFADPEMLRVDRLEYASTATVIFQRASVVVGDIVLIVGASVASGGNSIMAIALVLFNPALLIVDHIHFQYNGMLLGLLLLSAADIQQGRIYRGSVLFCALLNMKQIFLYVAPVYFVYLLRAHCGLGLHGKRFSLDLWALVRLGAAVLACFGVCWAPIVATGQVMQAASRLFPFGRGLTHAYWAPNVWAFYNTADRVLSKLGLGGQKGHSSTAGMAEVYESSVLWTIPPKATFLLTALAYIPLLALIWRSAPLPTTRVPGEVASVAYRKKEGSGNFLVYVGLGSAVAFSFGWHVHEKAILMVTVPLIVAAASDSGFASEKPYVYATATLSAVGTFSVLPLMPQKSTETVVKWVLLVFGHGLELLVLRHLCLRKCDRQISNIGLLDLLRISVMPGWVLALLFAFLGIYCDFGGHERVFGPQRMEFLPLMLISDFSAALVLLSFLRIFVLASGAASRELSVDSTCKKSE